MRKEIRQNGVEDLRIKITKFHERTGIRKDKEYCKCKSIAIIEEWYFSRHVVSLSTCYPMNSGKLYIIKRIMSIPSNVQVSIFPIYLFI